MLFDRSGAGPVFIPAAQPHRRPLDKGMAGKFVEKDGLLVLSWTLGTRELDTGSDPAADDKPPPQSPAELISAAPQANADSGK